MDNFKFSSSYREAIATIFDKGYGMSKLQKDIIERVFWTAVQAFLAVFVVTDVTSAKAAGVAALAAAISAVKGIAATRVGDPESAALMK